MILSRSSLTRRASESSVTGSSLRVLHRLVPNLEQCGFCMTNSNKMRSLTGRDMGAFLKRAASQAFRPRRRTTGQSAQPRVGGSLYLSNTQRNHTQTRPMHGTAIYAEQYGVVPRGGGSIDRHIWQSHGVCQRVSCSVEGCCRVGP